MFKKIRIGILLLILLGVALSAWKSNTKAHEWKRSQYVALYPINADGSPVTADYLSRLEPASFLAIHNYLGDEAQRHGLKLLYPINVMLGPQVATQPPSLSAGASALDAIKWSLAVRWWAWRNTPKTPVPADVRLYLIYHDPRSEQVPHSLGLAKGRIGIAHLYASRDMHGSNLVVATHELLHTFGATDKYDPESGLPIYPQGYAEPALGLPQNKAELMAGRVPQTETRALIPAQLSQTLIGPETAAEIGWRKLLQ